MTSAERECNSLFFERYNLQHKFQMHFFILIQGITKSPGMYILCSSVFMKKKRLCLFFKMMVAALISYVLRYQLKIKVKSCPHLSCNCIYQKRFFVQKIAGRVDLTNFDINGLYTAIPTTYNNQKKFFKLKPDITFIDFTYINIKINT